MNNNLVIIDKIKRRFKTLVQESNEFFQVISTDGTIINIDSNYKKLYNYKSKDIIGKKIYDFFDEEECTKIAKIIDIIKINPNHFIKEELITKDGVYIESFVINQLIDPSIQGIVIISRNISEKKETERKIDYISNYDEMTSLPNHYLFRNNLKIWCRKAIDDENSFALFMIVINEYKYFSQTLGYYMADDLILQIVKELKMVLGDEAFIYRYSEDQFAILLKPESIREEYLSILNEIINIFKCPIKTNGIELTITINIGISICPDNGYDSETLLTHANIALRQAKEEGLNKFIFFVHDLNIEKRIILMNDLYMAIDKDEFKVYYQPIIDLTSGEIVAVEALIRWHHPAYGVILPDEFIFLAEETRFIFNLGIWMLRKVCLNYKQWLNDDLPAVRVSINCSSIQFSESDFVNNIIDILSEFELDPSFLTLEITESTLMKKSDKVIADINALRSLGVKIAIDDFGVGFSSLSFLSSFKVDIIKIDRRFIENVLLDKTDMIITQSIINLAYDLNIEMHAEGIENLGQLLYLKKFNCRIGQGFLFSRPIRHKELRILLEKGKLYINELDIENKD